MATKNKVKKDILAQLLETEEELSTLEAYYLKDNGWEYTNSTPGKLWMWRKKWNRMMIMVPQDKAIIIQKNWDGI
jgi:hypothetical protein